MSRTLYTWESFFNRTKYNCMNGGEQEEYIESLKVKAEKANKKHNDSDKNTR